MLILLNRAREIGMIGNFLPRMAESVCGELLCSCGALKSPAGAGKEFKVQPISRHFSLTEICSALDFKIRPANCVETENALQIGRNLKLTRLQSGVSQMQFV
jgi:hypothetical protein